MKFFKVRFKYLFWGFTLYACAANSQSADSPWPMYMHDAQHTGQSQIKGPVNPSLAWVFDKIIKTAPVIGPNNIIYTASRVIGEEGGFYALYEDGTIKWKFPLPKGIIVNGIAVSHNNIYFTTSNAYTNEPMPLYILNHAGELITKLNAVHYGSPPVIDDDGTIYVNTGSKLYSINTDGSIKWTVSGTGRISVPAIGPNGDIYIVSDNTLYSYNPNGELNWSVPKGDDVGIGARSPVVSKEGTIYTCAYSAHKFTAFNPDGTEKWDYPITVSRQPCIGPDSVIYFVGIKDMWDDQPILYALNPDGTLKWKLNAKIRALMVDANETIYAISLDGNQQKLHSISSDGKVNWSYNVGSASSYDFLNCPPIINSNGDLYFIGQKWYTNNLFALFDVLPDQTPDLSVQSSDISFNPPAGKVSAGNIVQITAKLRELSGMQSAAAEVIFYYNDKTHPIDTVSVYASKDSYGFAHGIWNTYGLQDEDYTIIAEITNSNPAESDLSNNEAQTNYTFLPLIQKRIDQSNPGDTVWVEPGVYYENITLGNRIVLKSIFGPDSTIIDGLQRGSVVTIGPSQNSLATLDGFTITNGKGGDGGGINIPVGWNAIISNNIICNNTASCGGGIYVRWSQPKTIIRNNLIMENTATWLTDGIHTSQSECTIINNTIVNNTKGDGVGIESRNQPGESPDIRNCIVWGNGTDLSLFAEVRYSDVQNAHISQILTKTISIYPQFTDPENRNYNINIDSPCINAGDPLSPRDPDGTRSDMGAFYYDLTEMIGTISGAVTDSHDGKPIKNARVILSGTSDLDVATTNRRGEYQFYVREGNDYLLTAHTLGYFSASKKNFSIHVGESILHDIKLIPNPGPPVSYPPRNLSLNIDSTCQNQRILNWEAPQKELYFDDNTFENAYGFEEPNGSFIVGPFGSFDQTVTLDSVKLEFMDIRGGDSVRIFILVDTTNTPTTTELEYSIYTVIPYSNVYQDYNFSQFNIILKPGSYFYIGVEQLSYSSMYLKFDTDAPDTLAYVATDEPGVYYPLSAYGIHGVFATRAVITPISAPGHLIKPIKKENVVLNRKIIKKKDTVSPGDVSSIVRKKLKESKMNRKDSKPLLVENSTGKNTMSSLTGYNIYRYNSSPVTLEASNRINSKPIKTTAFIDTTLEHSGVYYYTVTAIYEEGESFAATEICDTVTIISTANFPNSNNLPLKYALAQNYPNPFNPETTIKYQLPKSSEVRLEIYNIIGEVIKILVKENQDAGYYTVHWNGKDDSNNLVASGVYFYILKSKDFIRSRKLVLIR